MAVTDFSTIPTIDQKDVRLTSWVSASADQPLLAGLSKQVIEFSGSDSSNQGVDDAVLGRDGNLHYTVNYLQFVADHCQDDKALATFLGVPG